jgi:hypothetical protein
MCGILIAVAVGTCSRQLTVKTQFKETIHDTLFTLLWTSTPGDSSRCEVCQELEMQRNGCRSVEEKTWMVRKT